MPEEKMVNEELYQQFFEIVGEGKKISQVRAAKELGLSAGTISAYRSRIYNGSITTIKDLMEAACLRAKGGTA